MGNIIREYQQSKIGKRLAKGWQKAAEKVGKCWEKRRPNVGPTSAQCRLDVGPTSAQRRPNVGHVGPPVKTTSRRRRTADVGPTLVPTSAQRRPNVGMLSGIVSQSEYCTSGRYAISDRSAQCRAALAIQSEPLVK